VGQRIRPIAVVIVAVHIVEETPDMFTQRSIEDDERSVGVGNEVSSAGAEPEAAG